MPKRKRYTRTIILRIEPDLDEAIKRAAKEYKNKSNAMRKALRRCFG